MNYQKVKVVKSTRGRGKDIAQNIRFEGDVAFVTGAYSSIDWRAREIMIARLARLWNMTAHLSDDELAIVEARLMQHAAER